MNIMLGNLSLAEIVEPEKLGKVQQFLDENGYERQEKCDLVDTKPGYYHIYDIPCQLHICDQNMVDKFIDFVKSESLIESFTREVGVVCLALVPPASGDGGGGDNV